MEGAQERFIAIDAFIGSFSFLANTSPSPVVYHGQLFPSVACALYCAQYSLTEEETGTLQKPWTTQQMPDEVKKLIDNSLHKEKSEWGTNRRQIMELLVRDKFRRQPILRQKLKETGNRPLIWSNTSDVYFGKVNHSGQNHLGRILMEIRENINNNVEFETWLALSVDIESDINLRPNITLVESKPSEKDIIDRHELDINRPFWILGKLPSSDIVALNPSVSRQHCIITVLKDGSVQLMDLKSTAGTHLNNKLIELDHVPYPLLHNSTLRCGASTRIYSVQISKRRVFEYLEKKKKELEKEILELHSSLVNPKNGLPTETRICVKNLSYTTSKSELVEFFESCGEIKPRNRPDTDDHRANRGIAFLTFMDPIGAANAIKKHESFLNARKISVIYARTHEPQLGKVPEGSWKATKDRSRSSRYERQNDISRNDRNLEKWNWNKRDRKDDDYWNGKNRGEHRKGNRDDHRNSSYYHDRSSYNDLAVEKGKSRDNREKEHKSHSRKRNMEEHDSIDRAERRQESNYDVDFNRKKQKTSFESQGFEHYRRSRSVSPPVAWEKERKKNGHDVSENRVRKITEQKISNYNDDSSSVSRSSSKRRRNSKKLERCSSKQTSPGKDYEKGVIRRNSETPQDREKVHEAEHSSAMSKRLISKSCRSSSNSWSSSSDGRLNRKYKQSSSHDENSDSFSDSSAHRSRKKLSSNSSKSRHKGYPQNHSIKKKTNVQRCSSRGSYSDSSIT